MSALRVLTALSVAAILQSASPEFISVERKFEAIESDRLKPGTRVSFTQHELDRWAADAVREVGLDGVRDTHLELLDGRVTGSARIDFLKLKQGHGQSPGWLLKKMLSGERPVTVTARLQSSRWQARVDVERVDVSGFEIDGSALDFLIQQYLIPSYPKAKISEWFPLKHHMERIDVHPSKALVTIGR